MLAGFLSIIFVLNFYFISNRTKLSIDIISENNILNSYNYSNIEENELNQIESFCEENTIQNQVVNKNEWSIEIPKIELKAEISNGTDQNTLNLNVGHFEETTLWNGNVGLAAHNRGYNVNYFNRLKELETGDEIIYIYQGNIRKYKVNYTEIIEETNWEILNSTSDNRITLITCVEDKPELRRCVQAIEIKEE